MADVKFVVNSDGSMNKWQDLGRVSTLEKMLTEYASERGTSVERAFTVDGNKPVNMFVKPAHWVLETVIDGFPMNTFYSLIEGKLYPEFWQNSSGSLVRRTCNWKTPEGMRLHFVIKALKCRVGGTDQYKLDNPFWFATNGRPGFLKLPLPNTYSDGRGCMGDNVARMIKPTLQELFQMTLDTFRASDWNSDAPPDMAMARKMFRFDPATNESLPPGESWPSLCLNVNHQVMMEAIP